jgi:hypothetical protein
MMAKEAKHTELLGLIEREDPPLKAGETLESVSTDGLRGALRGYFGDSREFSAAVLGIDIYRYSKYPHEQQRLIPSVFRMLFEQTISLCKEHEQFMFQTEQFANRFISTGDGGFAIFDTPMQAIVFATWFQAVLSPFNSGYDSPRLRSFLGAPLTLRYTLTFGQLFRLDMEYFGAAIINNARILSRDSLNRFLIDDASLNWFNFRIRSFENLIALSREDLVGIPEFSGYDSQKLKNGSMMFPRDKRGGAFGEGAFHTAIVQKIGEIQAKNTHLDIHSAYLQVGLSHGREGDIKKNIVITLGNLNSSGLNL